MPLKLGPVLRAFRPAVAATGRGVSTAGEAAASVANRGLRATGQGLGVAAEAAATPLGRQTLGTGAGAGLGYGASVASPDYVDPWVSTLAGGTTGLAATSPGFRSQLRYAANVPEGGKFGAGSALSLLFKPRYPAVEPALTKAMPKWGPRIANAARTAPLAATAVGMGLSGTAMVGAFPDNTQMMAQGMGVQDPKVLNDLWWRTLKKSPSMTWHAYAPGRAGGDTTPIGDIQREYTRRTLAPAARKFVHDVRTDYPGPAFGIDAIRSTTPAGFIATRYLNRLASPKQVGWGERFQEVLRDKKENVLDRLDEIPDSPLAADYSNLLLHPDILKDEGFRHGIGTATGKMPADKRLQLGDEGRPAPTLTAAATNLDNPANIYNLLNAGRGPMGPLLKAPAVAFRDPHRKDYYHDITVNNAHNMPMRTEYGFDPYAGLSATTRRTLGATAAENIEKAKASDLVKSPVTRATLRLSRDPRLRSYFGNAYDRAADQITAD